MNKNYLCYALIFSIALLEPRVLYSKESNETPENNVLRLMVERRVPYSPDTQDVIDILLQEQSVRDAADPVIALKELEVLSLGQSKIKDITVLAQLINLRQLYLYDNEIKDITPLTELIHLQTLNLSNNQIEDITALAKLRNLEYLELSDNQIKDVAPLAKLTKLRELNLFNNQIEDAKPLIQLTKLKWLDVYGNKIQNRSFLTKLRKLGLADPETYFEIACGAQYAGTEKKVELLLAQGANVNFQNAEGKTPLMIASRFGNEKIVDLLLNNNANVNLQTKNGESALLEAISSPVGPQVKIVKKLLEHGADSNCLITDDTLWTVTHYTPLSFAVNRQSISWSFGNTKEAVACDEIIALLLAHKASLNKGDTSLLTDVILANDDRNYVNKSCELLKLLIAHGADVNYKCKHTGETPLHRAMEVGCKDRIRLLLDAKADPYIRCHKGKTPLDCTTNEDLKLFLNNFISRSST